MNFEHATKVAPEAEIIVAVLDGGLYELNCSLPRSLDLEELALHIWISKVGLCDPHWAPIKAHVPINSCVYVISNIYLTQQIN